MKILKVKTPIITKPLTYCTSTYNGNLKSVLMSRVSRLVLRLLHRICHYHSLTALFCSLQTDIFGRSL